MAAQSLVRPSFAEPRMTYEVNVMGTVNVLDAVRRDGNVRVVVNVTSDKCYENREWEWAYREARADGRPRSLLELQGLRRAGHGCLPALLLPGRGRDSARVGARGQRDRRRRLGGKTV